MKNIFIGIPEESLGYLLSRVYGIRLKKMSEELASIGINYVQYNMLIGLYWLQLHGESVNQMMLINHTKLDKSVVSNTLREMSKNGSVSRMECPTDTRSKLVKLTAKGENLAEQAIKIVNRIDETFWGEHPQKQICSFLSEIIKINS